MIKAIVADVDGVMIGKREGINFPMPSTVIIDAFKHLNVPLILCSAKYFPAIEPIIIAAGLKNPHITDAGAFILDPLGKQRVLRQSIIARSVVESYVRDVQADYTELCTADGYYVRNDVDPAFMKKRAAVVQCEPTLVDSLEPIAATKDVVKIISFASNDDDMPRLEAYAKTFGDNINFIWSGHPFLYPKRPIVLTASGVSKATATDYVLQQLGITFDETLGVGDSPADWVFMQHCKYVATVGDKQELLDLARTKPDHFLAGSVDNDAMLDILKHFKLLTI